MSETTEVLLIGGRAGVGKTSIAAELHAQLSDSRVRHALIEGDNLDQAWPAPHENGLQLAEANLAAMWQNYRDAGYSRLIYTNTASVRDDVIHALLSALGGRPVATGVLLTAGDRTTATRLRQREIGSVLDEHLERSRLAAEQLDCLAPTWVHRIRTDDTTVTGVAQHIKELLRWTAQ